MLFIVVLKVLDEEVMILDLTIRGLVNLLFLGNFFVFFGLSVFFRVVFLFVLMLILIWESIVKFFKFWLVLVLVFVLVIVFCVVYDRLKFVFMDTGVLEESVFSFDLFLNMFFRFFKFVGWFFLVWVCLIFFFFFEFGNSVCFKCILNLFILI